MRVSSARARVTAANAELNRLARERTAAENALAAEESALTSRQRTRQESASRVVLDAGVVGMVALSGWVAAEQTLAMLNVAHSIATPLLASVFGYGAGVPALRLIDRISDRRTIAEHRPRIEGARAAVQAVEGRYRQAMVHLINVELQLEAIGRELF